MSVEVLALDREHIDRELAKFEQELVNPALGELVMTAAQVYVNPYAEKYSGEGRMRDQKPEDYEVPLVCREYNNIPAEEQREVTTLMLNGLSPESSRQAYVFEVVERLLAATVRSGDGRVPLAFEDEWREWAWEVLWKDEDYQKVRGDVRDALSDEARIQATWMRNLTALNIMAAISAGRYHKPKRDEKED